MYISKSSWQDLRALKIQHTKIVDTALIFAVEGAKNDEEVGLSLRWDPPEKTQTQQFGHTDEETGETGHR